MPARQQIENLRERIIKNFVDVIILRRLEKDCSTGYDIILAIQKKFNILTNSRKIYSTLDSLEKKGLIKSEQTLRKKSYRLTKNGEQAIQSLRQENGDIQNILKNTLIF